MAEQCDMFRILVTHTCVFTHTHSVFAPSIWDSIVPLQTLLWARKELLMLINFKVKLSRREIIVSKWGALVGVYWDLVTDLSQWNLGWCTESHTMVDLIFRRSFPCGSDSKESTWNEGDWVQLLEKEMATYSSILPRGKEKNMDRGGKLQSMETQRVGHNWATKHKHRDIVIHTISLILAQLLIVSLELFPPLFLDIIFG